MVFNSSLRNVFDRDLEGGIKRRPAWQQRKRFTYRHLCVNMVVLSILSLGLFQSSSYLQKEDLQSDINYWSGKAKGLLKKQCQISDYSCRVREGFSKQDMLLQRQSKTVEEAVSEYVRRYKRTPPKGFEDWAQYALDNDALLIDEYDQIEASLLPFRGLSYEIANVRMNAALKANAQVTEDRKLGELTIKDGKVAVTGFSYGKMTNTTMEEILKDVEHLLPDLRVLYNWAAQPRVLGERITDDQIQGIETEDVVFEDRAEKDNWDVLRAACPSTYVSRNSLTSDRPDLDICNLKEENRDQHGMFVGPHTLLVTETLVPILSRAKLSTNRDILVPNTCYWNNDYRGWNRPDETPFNEKRPALYWRGMTTGETVTKQTFFKSQRLRFVNLMQWLRGTSELHSQFQYDGKVSSEALEQWKLLESTRKSADINIEEDYVQKLPTLDPGMYDVAFSRVYAADSQETEDLMQEVYRFTHHESAKNMFSYQYLPDIDGESMSCRFYSQLGSNGVPLKQTMFAEWHDDRIVPWAHYIPISTDYNEVPEILVWLRSAEGQRYSEQIASAGAFWEKHLFRKVDITLFYYRLLLEYSSLFR